MSWYVTEAVIITEGIPPLAKLVLCVLAKHANHDGSATYPSQDTITKMTGMGQKSNSTVAKWLAWLEAERYIVPQGFRNPKDNKYRDANDGGGRGNSVAYRICTERLHHVEGLQYENGVNLPPHRTFSDEKDPRGERNLPRGEENLPPRGINLPRGEENLPPRGNNSVLESVPESVIENQSEEAQRSLVGSGDLGERLATTTDLVVVGASHEDAGDSREDNEPLAAMIAAMKQHCRRTGSESDRYYDDCAREALDNGMTPADVGPFVEGYKLEYKRRNRHRQPYHTPSNINAAWKAQGHKPSPIVASPPQRSAEDLAALQAGLAMIAEKRQASR